MRLSRSLHEIFLGSSTKYGVCERPSFCLIGEARTTFSTGRAYLPAYRYYSAFWPPIHIACGGSMPFLFQINARPGAYGVLTLYVI